jgi:hypothetical protein
MGKRIKTCGSQDRADVGDHLAEGKEEVDPICDPIDKKEERSLKQCSKDPGGRKPILVGLLVVLRRLEDLIASGDDVQWEIADEVNVAISYGMVGHELVKVVVGKDSYGTTKGVKVCHKGSLEMAFIFSNVDIAKEGGAQSGVDAKDNVGVRSERRIVDLTLTGPA